jgi:putative ABC transport system substrate-binding protein
VYNQLSEKNKKWGSFMKRKTRITSVCFLLLCLLLAACGNAQTSSEKQGVGGEQKTGQAKEKVKIGITQLIEHPSLDASREGTDVQ